MCARTPQEVNSILQQVVERNRAYWDYSVVLPRPAEQPGLALSKTFWNGK